MLLFQTPVPLQQMVPPGQSVRRRGEKTLMEVKKETDQEGCEWKCVRRDELQQQHKVLLQSP